MRIQVFSPKSDSWIHVPARDSIGLSILRKRSCDKSATKCIAIQDSRWNPQKIVIFMCLFYINGLRAFF